LSSQDKLGPLNVSISSWRHLSLLTVLITWDLNLIWLPELSVSIDSEGWWSAWSGSTSWADVSALLPMPHLHSSRTSWALLHTLHRQNLPVWADYRHAQGSPAERRHNPVPQSALSLPLTDWLTDSKGSARLVGCSRAHLWPACR
jgi:hypothetical protein